MLPGIYNPIQGVLVCFLVYIYNIGSTSMLPGIYII